MLRTERRYIERMANFEKIQLSESDDVLMCPKDGVPMERYRIGEGDNAIEIDRCPECGGIYLDRGELAQLMAHKFDSEKLLKQLDREPAAGGAPSGEVIEMKCPRDGTPMVTYRAHDQKHLEYEVCPQCGGIFFDAGELHDLSKVTLLDRLRGLLVS